MGLSIVSHEKLADIHTNITDALTFELKAHKVLFIVILLRYSALKSE